MSSYFIFFRLWKRFGFLLAWMVAGPLIFGQTTDVMDLPPSRDVAVMQNGPWQIEYNLKAGTADILFNGKLVISQAYAVVRLPEVITSRDLKFHTIERHSVRDGFGRGTKFVVESSNGGDEKMIQDFWLYNGVNYFFADVEVSAKKRVASNFMSPITSQTPSNFVPAGDDRALFVPFDNDMWVHYDAEPFGSSVTSYEVSALYDNTSRHGLVVGSVEHDVWKTGIISTTSSNAITSLEVFGGITSTDITHDALPHGKISGKVIKSPRIFIGCFDDWRDGLETFAGANAVIAPRRPWKSGVPFGWNSWGKLQFNLNYEKAIQVSDFFAKQLPDFKDDGVAYIGLDAGWTLLSEEQLKEFVLHCHANYQEAGIYFTPFTAWTHDGNQRVNGTPWHYKDIYLYANGQVQTIDGGVALDPTHPGTQALIRSDIRHFQRDGFKYIKADFMTHGALEADRHYDPKVTTGIEAYNEGMKFVRKVAGKGMYLNLSISPLFPAQYANSRRISCDTYGRIDQTEYMLNSLTYSWWLGKVYDFNDADHMVLNDFSEGENRARITSSAITGIFISGDDFSDAGGVTGKERAREFLTNQEICNVARIRKSFEPVEGNTDNHAGNLFSYKNGDNLYLAVFNFSNAGKDFTIDPQRIGLNPGDTVNSKELWSGTVQTNSGTLSIHVAPEDAVLFKFYPRNNAQTR
jgi:alpha-galactosidase